MSKFVVHCRKAHAMDVYIGRPSEWGNPFLIGRDGSREAVVAKFAHMIDHDEAKKEEIRRELKGKILACYCAPDLCHGDVLHDVSEGKCIKHYYQKEQQ